MADWSQIPIELLERIAEPLVFLSDLLNFSYVCTAWASAASSKRQRFCPRLPLLMLPGESHTMTSKFFSVPEKRVYTTHLPQIYRKWCCGSSKGWLVLVDAPRSEVKLFNPFSRVEVQLPPLTKFPYPGYFDHRIEQPRTVEFIFTAIISSDPTQSSDCVVMAIVSENRLLCFCRPGDERWTAMETPYLLFDAVIHYRGLFYVIDVNGAVVACDVSTKPRATIVIPTYTLNAIYKKKYFVESTTGDLLLIVRHMEYEEPDDLQMPDSMNRYRKGYHTVKFEILKLDVISNEWFELHNIGDQILLLGHGASISFSAHDLPDWRKNSIYFTDDHAHGYRYFAYGCHDMGVFSFEYGSITPLHVNNGPWFDPLIWVTQNP